MSSRAIRALRGDASLLPPGIPGTVEEDETDDDDDDEPVVRGPSRVFAVLNNDDDDSSETDEASSSSSHPDASDDKTREPDVPETEGKRANVSGSKDEGNAPPEEDLDALLAEFHGMDEVTAASTTALEDTMVDRRSSPYDIILANFDVRHLDYDFVMRTAASSAGANNNHNNNNNNTAARPVSFGPPHGDWRRPPRLVGGGIGMTTYRLDPFPLPAPYILDDDPDAAAITGEWYTFVHSDTVQRDMEDFRLIQQTGDLTALGMFLCHHPYVADGLLQYSSVLYQTNRIFEGMSLLKRTLYLFESSALSSFWDRLGRGRVCFVDYDRLENQQFFRALFRLVQVSHIAGLSRTALASSRLLLALDPLRDPMGVLLMLDRQALAVAYQAIEVSEQRASLQWLVDLVESKVIRLYYQDSSLPDKTEGGLLDLCNWAYSYPLALFSLAQLERLDGNDDSFRTYSEKADHFLDEAMLRFPSVIPLLLQNLEVDTTGRSFQRDWVKVLDFAESRSRSLKKQWQASCEDVVNLSATLQTMERVSKIFVLNPSKQWVDEDTLQWFFDHLQALSNLDGELASKLPSSPSIMRYANVKVSDFQARNELLPEDANIIDPNVVAEVMAPMQPGRQRFLRRQQLQNMGHDLNVANAALQQPPPAMFGPPRNAIDLDWPMAEVFWRSFLPWNYVEGLPPPPR